MRIVLGANHRGYILKNIIADALRSEGHEVLDVGANSGESVDYPDYALAISRTLLSGQAERGVLVCGSGVGAAIAANKIPGIRAGLCHDTYSAHQGVEHDDMNLLCLGSRVIGPELALELARTFLRAEFTPKERYLRRLAKVRAIEERAVAVKD